jgi:uncharacterized protein YdeI (YjbR/CyaY-like superfamily)
LKVAPDLAAAFGKNRKAFTNFEAFPRSAKKFLLQWISSAKRPETRQRRISETVARAAKNLRANQ